MIVCSLLEMQVSIEWSCKLHAPSYTSRSPNIHSHKPSTRHQLKLRLTLSKSISVATTNALFRPKAVETEAKV